MKLALKENQIYIQVPQTHPKIWAAQLVEEQSEKGYIMDWVPKKMISTGLSKDNVPYITFPVLNDGRKRIYRIGNGPDSFVISLCNGMAEECITPLPLLFKKTMNKKVTLKIEISGDDQNILNAIEKIIEISKS